MLLVPVVMRNREARHLFTRTTGDRVRIVSWHASALRSEMRANSWVILGR